MLADLLLVKVKNIFFYFGLQPEFIYFFVLIESEIMIDGDDKVQNARSCLVDECSFMCSLADSSLTAIMKKIFDGTIALKNMEYVLKRKHQVEKLCDANGSFASDEVDKILKCRSSECSSFREYKNRLASLCSKLQASKLQING